MVAGEGFGIEVVTILVRNRGEGDAFREALCRRVRIDLDRRQFDTLHLHRGEVLVLGRRAGCDRERERDQSREFKMSVFQGLTP